jgi:adenylate cyclase
VDDDEASRSLLSRRLQQQGHAPEPATDGEHALTILAGKDYDLVLLDIVMPKLNGFDTLARMKADDRLRHVPVIVISSLDEVQSVARCLEMGADDYVTKPFNTALLRARVESCLAKKRLRDQEQAHTQQLTQRLAALSDVSVAINSLDVDVVLEQILDLSKQVMTAEASSLLVVDREIGKLRFHVARGTAGAALKSVTVEIGQGIAGWVAQTGEPLLIPDAYQDSRFDSSYDQRTGFRTRSILTVPIRIKNEIEGVVQVINKRGDEKFDQEDLRLFQSFAGMASASLENARLFEQTKQQAEDLRAALEAERRLSIEKEKMGAYIPKQLVDDISRNREQTLALGGKLVHGTIMFSDIRGFTRLSEHMAPQAVVAFLNEYMTAMTKEIENEGGIIDKFIGDGIMAEFLPLDTDDNHALRAVRAGIRMQQRLHELERAWRTTRPELTGIQCRVGINTGEVVSGNIGSQTRMDYTVIGDNVNLTSRIESNGRGGEVHLSESTYLEVKDHIEAVRLDPIQVKNRVQPVQVYAIQVNAAD